MSLRAKLRRGLALLLTLSMVISLTGCEATGDLWKDIQKALAGIGININTGDSNKEEFSAWLNTFGGLSGKDLLKKTEALVENFDTTPLRKVVSDLIEIASNGYDERLEPIVDKVAAIISTLPAADRKTLATDIEIKINELKDMAVSEEAKENRDKAVELLTRLLDIVKVKVNGES